MVPTWTLIQLKLTLVLAAVDTYLVQLNNSLVSKNPHLNLCQIHTYLCAISLDEKNWVIYQEWGTKIPSKKNKPENAFSLQALVKF